jgi:hypothetical protein
MFLEEILHALLAGIVRRRKKEIVNDRAEAVYERERPRSIRKASHAGEPAAIGFGDYFIGAIYLYLIRVNEQIALRVLPADRLPPRVVSPKMVHSADLRGVGTFGMTQ